MGNLAGEAENRGLKLHFDARLRLEFRGAKVTTDAGLLAVIELDEAQGLTEMAGVMIQEGRTGRNIRHQMTVLLRQSLYVRFAGYEDVNGHVRLFRDPAMRAVIGRKALERTGASSQTISNFETETLAADENLAAHQAINHAWVGKAMLVAKAGKIVLDMDSSEFPVYGYQEGSAYNGHFNCTCYHPPSSSTSLGTARGLA